MQLHVQSLKLNIWFILVMSSNLTIKNQYYVNELLFSLLITLQLSVQLSSAFALDINFEHVFAFSEQCFKIFRGISNEQLSVQSQK